MCGACVLKGAKLTDVQQLYPNSRGLGFAAGFALLHLLLLLLLPYAVSLFDCCCV